MKLNREHLYNISDGANTTTDKTNLLIVNSPTDLKTTTSITDETELHKVLKLDRDRRTRITQLEMPLGSITMKQISIRYRGRRQGENPNWLWVQLFPMNGERLKIDPETKLKKKLKSNICMHTVSFNAKLDLNKRDCIQADYIGMHQRSDENHDKDRFFVGS